MNFLERVFCIFIQIPLEFVPKRPEVLTCRLTCEKLLPDLILTNYITPKLPHGATMTYHFQFAFHILEVMQLGSQQLELDRLISLYLQILSTIFGHFYETVLVNDERSPPPQRGFRFQIPV